LFLAVFSLKLASTISTLLTVTIFVYTIIQVAYCLRLKKEPLLDLLCIASGFILRSIAGGVAADVYLSPWFLLTVGLLALFLAVEKRKAELQNSNKNRSTTRHSLERYSLPLLLRLEGLVSTSAFISYSLWASGPTLNGASTSWMLLTVPFVLLGIFQYQLLSDPEEATRRRAFDSYRTSESPDEILLSDRGIKLTLIGWFISTAMIIALSHAN